MRAWSLFGLLLLAGCEAHNPQPKSAPKVKEAGAKEEPYCEFCATPSRADLLSKGKEAGKMKLTTITYAPFMKALQAQAGKVVLVYAWASPQPASQKYLPAMVALQRKYAKDGLVCMTMSIDPEQKRAEALKWLVNSQSDLANYLQGEGDTEPWEQCLGCCGVPTVAIYGRDGKRAASFDGSETPLDLALIEATVQKQLQTK